MGADGGYRYIPAGCLEKILSKEDIELFIRFIRHSLTQEVWMDENDLARKTEAKLETGFLRFPDGTDIDPKLHSCYYNFDHFDNTPQEIWYFKEFAEENDHLGYNCWSHPAAWYEFYYREGKARYKLPTPEELDRLVAITECINERNPSFYVETWT